MERDHAGLRYIDIFLESFAAGNEDSLRAFGHHVHWGYWDDPAAVDGSSDDFRRAAEEMTRRICDMAGIGDGQRVLDVGCGFGGTLASLDERFHGMSLVGLNYDGRQLARAREQVRPRAGNELRWVEGDACDMPLEDGSFDVVVAIESACHFASRECFFREARRLLRPEGRMVVSDFVVAGIAKPATAAWDLLFGRWFARVYGEHRMSFTAGDYRRLARATGFAPVEERDVTRHTLPSYPHTRRLMSSFARPRLETATNNWINWNMEVYSQLGLLRYVLLSFRCSRSR